MKVQTLFVVASAICGVLAAPVQKREPKVVTITEKVVHVVTATSTVWVTAPEPTLDEDNAHYVSHTTTSSTTSTTSTSITPTPTTTSTSSTSTTPTTTATPSTSSTSTTTTRTPTPTSTSTTETPVPTTTYTPPPSTTTTTTPYVAPTTSSTPTPTPEPEPTPSPSPSPEPSPVLDVTSKLSPVPTTSAAPESSPSPTASADEESIGGGGGAIISGEATFYDVGLGSCGIQSTDGELVVAISHILMDAANTGNPNNNPLCGKKIKCTRGGNSVTVVVVDRCVGCDATTLDLSPEAFNQLGLPAEGRIPIEWSWL